MATPTLRFSERMSGYISAGDRMGGDFGAAYEAGRAQGTSIQLEATITHHDLPALLEDAGSPATLTGTVLAPMLCPSPLDVAAGTFVLLERHPEEVDTEWMRYRMTLRSRTDPSKTFFLEGHKIINVGSILAAWKHTTTLYVTIYEGDTPDASTVRALGVMHIGLTDVHHLLSHAEVLNVNRATRERYLVRFVAMFARSIWPFYGGALNELGRFPVSTTSGATRPAEEALGGRRVGPAVRWGRPMACLGRRSRRLLPTGPISRRRQGSRDAGIRLRHVGDVDAHADDPPEPRRVPSRRGV